MAETMLAAWREQRGYWAALALLYSRLQPYSVAEVAAAMTAQDVRRLARHIKAAVAAGKASPDAVVMGIGVLAVAAGRLTSREEAAKCLETTLAAAAAPAVVRAAAAWAQGYLQMPAAENALQEALAAGGEVEKACREALARLGRLQ